MNIEMAWAEAESGAALDRRQIAQHAILEAIDLERAGVLGLVCLRIVAARHHDRRLVARRGQDLMRKNSDVEFFARRDLFAERAVRLDAMDRDVARIVVGGQQIFARAVDAAMHRPRRQRCDVAVRRERAGRRIDAERGGDVPGAGNGARAAVARHHVEKFLRRMRPDVLDIGAGRGHRISAGQRRAIDVDVVAGKLRTDALIEHRLGHGVLRRNVCISTLHGPAPENRKSIVRWSRPWLARLTEAC